MKIKKQIDTKWRQWKNAQIEREVRQEDTARKASNMPSVCDTSREREVRERAKRDVAEVYETKWAEEEGK